MGNFVYEYKNAIYFNLTNKCSNNCTFCVRNHATDLKDKNLWLNCEPSYEEIINKIPLDVSKYDEFVFCGYGEPTYRIDLVEKLSKHLKQFGKPIRINTNGQGNLINEKNIIDKLKYIDIISISLNAPNKEIYQKICNCIYGEKVFNEIIDFAIQCKNLGKQVVFTLVDIINKDEIKETKKLCKNLDIKLRIRNYY